MESFKFLYLEACENLNILPCEKILSRLEDIGKSNSLNLLGAQLTDETCKAFGQALAKDVHFKELDCSNCMFSDESLINILLGLEKNKFLLTLNLKGNNIRSSGTEILGKFLRHNNHLQNLLLEWNGIGIFPEKFAIFCEGVCANSSLKLLDLRNNQLSHICAQSLSDVILRNSSLQKLDLRWNNIGLIGGRAILKSLVKNKTIISLETSGNYLPSDLEEAIEIATSASAQRYISNNEYAARSKFLTSKLQEKELERNIQVKSLMEQLERMEKDSSTNERWIAKKLAEAQEALDEKDKICESLTAKIRELESELWSLSEAKNHLALTLNAAEVKNKELADNFQLALDRQKEGKQKIERELLEKLGSLKEENLFLKQQIQDLKISQNDLLEQISKLQETISKLESLLKQDEESFKDKVVQLNERHAKALKENEELHHSDISRIRDEFSEHEKIFKQKISLLESRKIDLEQELKEKNTQVYSERAHAEEMQIQLEKKLKSDHEIIRQQLEERIEMLEDANKELNDHLQKNLQMLYELRTSMTGFELESAEQMHEIEHLKKCLEEKDVEMKANETKIKLEVKEQIEELSTLKEKFQEKSDTIESLQQKIKEMETKCKEELNGKDSIIQCLSVENQLQQEKIKEMVQNERNRTSQLQKAFESFLTSAGHTANENASPSGDTSL